MFFLIIFNQYESVLKANAMQCTNLAPKSRRTALAHARSYILNILYSLCSKGRARVELPNMICMPKTNTGAMC